MNVYFPYSICNKRNVDDSRAESEGRPCFNLGVRESLFAYRVVTHLKMVAHHHSMGSIHPRASLLLYCYVWLNSLCPLLSCLGADPHMHSFMSVVTFFGDLYHKSAHWLGECEGSSKGRSYETACLTIWSFFCAIWRRVCRILPSRAVAQYSGITTSKK